MKTKVKIGVVQGVGGLCIYLDDYRIAGIKPYGGGHILKEWNVDLEEIEERCKKARENKNTTIPIPDLPPEIPRALLGMIVDEVFGGAIEDATVIEDIYRVIAKYSRSGVPHDE